MLPENPSYNELLEKIEELRNIAAFQDNSKENLLKQLAENIEDVFWLRSNNEMIYINPAFEEVWGTSRNEIYKNPQIFTNSIHPQDKEAVFNILNSNDFKTKGYFEYEYRIIRPDNTIRWIHAKTLPIYNKQKEIAYRVGLARDITKYKHTEKETELLAEMLDIAPNSITVHDKEGRFLYANQKTFELHGYSKEEFMSLRIQELDVPESAELIQERMASIHEKGEARFEVEHFKKDGTKIPLEVFVKLVDWKGSSAMLSIATDISERKKMLGELLQAKKISEESNRFYKTTFDEAAVGIAHVYPNGSIFKVNTKFCEITGYSEEELTKLNFSEITHPDDLAKEAKYIEKVLANEINAFSIEKRYRHKEGHFIWIILNSNVLREKDGTIISAICTISDISIRKNLHFDLLKAKEKAEEANRLKTEFLNNMSHEIRTPMNGIIGFSEMLENPNLPEEKRNKFTRIIRNSSHQLLQIIDDILEISTLETKQNHVLEETVCLNGLFVELISNLTHLAEEKKIPILFKKQLSDSESIIVSDRDRLKKILMKLLDNALKFTQQGSIETGCYLNENKLILYVEDTGIGISPENHNLVFERFSQENKEISRKYGGLGLGLSIAKENIDLLGGTISLKSEKGKGTKFSICFPYKAQQNTNTTETPAKTDEVHPLKKEHYTILVAEDEEIIFFYIKTLLEDQGLFNYTLLHAINGKEAVELCVQHKNIDIVLMDIKMPVMDGYEATSRIKSLFPDLPIIAQTAYSKEADKALALKHGCNDFISKPLNKDKLIELIAKHLNAMS